MSPGTVRSSARSTSAVPASPSKKYTPLRNDLVGAQQCRLRHLDSERLGGLQVDADLILRRNLHRDLGRAASLQDLIDERSGTSVALFLREAVAREPAGVCAFARGMERRQAMPVLELV